MPRTRYHLTEHAAFDTIPLRVGVVPTSRKVYLEDIVDDPEGTANQTFSQKEKGRKHQLADIWTQERGGDFYGRWRVVSGPLGQEGQDPPVFTVLPIERETARTAANLTDLLANERKSSHHTWLTPEYVAQTLHGLVKDGVISNQAHLAAHIRGRVESAWSEENDAIAQERDKVKDHLLEASRQAQEAQVLAEQATKRAEQAEQGKQALQQQVQELIAALAAQNSSPPGAPPEKGTIEQANLRKPAKAVTKKWRSRTSNSRYLNIGVDAFIEDVTRQGNKISLRFIDSKGDIREIQDFGVINGFVSSVFDYLHSRKSQRAVFLVTYMPGGPLKLASDTMMLEDYRLLWR